MLMLGKTAVVSGVLGRLRPPLLLHFEFLSRKIVFLLLIRLPLVEVALRLGPRAVFVSNARHALLALVLLLLARFQKRPNVCRLGRLPHI